MTQNLNQVLWTSRMKKVQVQKLYNEDAQQQRSKPGYIGEGRGKCREHVCAFMHSYTYLLIIFFP
jgi:hypothetical protein